MSTITSNNNNNNNFKTLLYSGKCYLYSGKCFGFWEAFGFLGSVLQLSVDFLLSVVSSLGDLPALKTFLSLIVSRNNKMSQSERKKSD